MKSDEVVSATAGKEEALTSALAEITHLKEEILTKTYVLSLYHIAKFTVFWLDETYFFCMQFSNLRNGSSDIWFKRTPGQRASEMACSSNEL